MVDGPCGRPEVVSQLLSSRKGVPFRVALGVPPLEAVEPFLTCDSPLRVVSSPNEFCSADPGYPYGPVAVVQVFQLAIHVQDAILGKATCHAG